VCIILKEEFMRKPLCIHVAFLVALSLTGFASVHADCDRSVTFRQFHAYSWGKMQTKSDLRVDRQLQTAGWQRATDGGDIIIVALAGKSDDTYPTCL
jgi:hypothetical protein